MTSPFDPGPVTEVPLLHAPLVRVLCQVKWPQLIPVKNNLDSFADQLGTLIADHYPISSSERENQVTITPEGVTQTPGGKLHKFESADGEWRVTFGETFLALETTHYSSRLNFCNRLANVITALKEVANIPYAIRLGFRYTNRIDSSEEQYSQLEELVNFSVLGGAPVPLTANSKRLHSLSEAVFQVDNVRLLSRSAQLPAGATMDTAILPSSNPSWVLDLDAFQEGEKIEFDASLISEKVGTLSELAYKFFRWVVTDKFLKSYGGDV